MSANNHSPEDLDSLREIRDAVVAGHDDRAEHLAARLNPTDSVERTVVAAMDRVRYERGTYRRFTGGLIRWLRRAARDDQTWAIGRIGVEWWPQLSLASRGNDRDDVTTEPEIEQEEAERCLAIAAERGHRQAAFRHGTLESLLAAYGDGSPDELIDAEDLRSIQARIAFHYAESDDASAVSWFRRAVASPRWEDDDGQATWLGAVGAYARWAHAHGDVDLCDQLSARVVDDAVVEGAADRCALAGDAHKPYRNRYQLAASNEAARWKTMEHLLLEHELTPDMGLELLRLLSRNHYFRRDDRELAAAVWVRRYGPIRDAPVVESRAWELIGWLLTDVVPSVLRTFGCDEHANRVEDVSGTLDLSIHGFWEPNVDDSDRMRQLGERYWGIGEPLDEVATAEYEAFTSYHRHPLDGFIDEIVDPERASGWRAVQDSASTVDGHLRHNLLRFKHPVQSVGLDSVASAFESGLRPWVSEREYRLLGGSDAWLAMWLATSTPEPDGWRRSLTWCNTWDRISPMIAEYITTAAVLVAGRRFGADTDPHLVAAFDEMQTKAEEGIRRRVASLMEAAAGEPAKH